MSRSVLGVGFLGAGPVTQAIHLPTLARLPDLFRVVNIMDVSPEVAQTVASRAQARASTSQEELLADPEVDVVVICSPPQFHASQVIAAMEAGKKAILCEKPLATDAAQAHAIAQASERFGVPIVVGAMHAFDPGWQAAAEAWAALGAKAHTVRSRIVLGPNDRYEDRATEVLARPVFDASAFGGEQTLAATQGLVTAAVLGLAVHDLPLVRSLLKGPGELEVEAARMLPPFGYLISGSAGGTDVELLCTVNGHWESYWELEAIAEDAKLTIRFTPSYVQAGSAVATLTTTDEPDQVFGPYPHNGYENEWRQLHRRVGGQVDAVPPPKALIEDLTFVLEVAEKSSAAMAEEATA